MTFKIASRVWQTSATTGTGTLSLDASSNPTGYRKFVDAIGSGNTCPYVIDDEQGNWEEGIGTVTSGTTDTLARTTVINNSLGTTAKINFAAGTKTVQITPLGERAWWWNSDPTTGQIGITNSNGGMDPTSVPVAIGPYVVGRNVLINAGFAIDQRNSGVSTAISDDTYCFDRWYVLTQTAAVNVSQLSEPEDGYPFALRLTQNQVAAQRMGFAQIVEGVNGKHLRGGSGTLVPRIRCSSSQAIRYAILGWTGTEDAVTSDVVNSWTNGSFTAGQFFNSTTLSVLAVGAVTPAANTFTSLAPLTAALGSAFKNLIVFCWTEGTAAQSVTLDCSFIQLEAGAVATAFERRDIGTELERCQRYFQALVYADSYVAAGFAYNSGASADALAQYLVQMRATPTITLPGAGSGANQIRFFTALGGGAGTTVGSHAVTGSSPIGMTITGTGYAGLTNASPAFLFATTSAKFLLSAEL